MLAWVYPRLASYMQNEITRIGYRSSSCKFGEVRKLNIENVCIFIRLLVHG